MGRNGRDYVRAELPVGRDPGEVRADVRAAAEAGIVRSDRLQLQTRDCGRRSDDRRSRDRAAVTRTPRMLPVTSDAESSLKPHRHAHSAPRRPDASIGLAHPVCGVRPSPGRLRLRRGRMSCRLIISFSVVGLMCRSSAARFCTPPAASSADSISRARTPSRLPRTRCPPAAPRTAASGSGLLLRTWSGTRSASMRWPGRQHDGALDDVLELADVARPVVVDAAGRAPPASARDRACGSPRRTSRGSAGRGAGCRPCRSRSGGSCTVMTCRR